MVITVQENRLWLMGLILASALIGGAIVLYFQAHQSARSHGQSAGRFTSWLIGSALGLGAGAVGAGKFWHREFLLSETFGFEGMQYITLWFGCAGAFIGLGVAATVGHRAVTQRHSNTETRAEDREPAT